MHGQPCDGCKDATYSSGCPEPAFCGFAPIVCFNCSAGVSSSSCTNPVWCANYTCSDMCMDGMPMMGCPDPGACGFQPIKCVGCIPDHSTSSCPNPVWCGNFSTGTPPCYECMADMAMPGCPDPGVCGLAPLCQDCMSGMSMPNCPRPDACLTDVCVMNMFFGTSSHVCLFFSDWHISSAAQWTLAVFVILLLCFLREFSAAYRHHRSLQRKYNRQRNKIATSSTMRTPLLREIHGSESNDENTLWMTAMDSIYYTISVALSYLVMLLIMTYNVAVCLLVVLGCGFSHFVLAVLFTANHRRLKQQTGAAQLNLAVTPGSVLEGGASSSSSSSLRASSPSAPPAPGSATANMSGDHCCDGVDFDD